MLNYFLSFGGFLALSSYYKNFGTTYLKLDKSDA